MIWFSSDHHFFHKNIIRLSKRPFASLRDMEEHLITEWNKRVQPKDKVYIIGDFTCSVNNPHIAAKVISRLNGYKILIKGNHDMPAHKAIAAGINEVHENIFVWLTASSGKSYKVFLSHFPYRHNALMWLKHKIFGGYWDTRYNHKRMVDEGEWLIHGHTHQRYKQKRRMIHVGVDAWDYRPASHHEILNLIEDTPNETFMSRLIYHLHGLGLLPKRKTRGIGNAQAKGQGDKRPQISRGSVSQDDRHGGQG